MCRVIVPSGIARIPRLKSIGPAWLPNTGSNTPAISVIRPLFSKTPDAWRVTAEAITIIPVASTYGTNIPVTRSRTAKGASFFPHPFERMEYG